MSKFWEQYDSQKQVIKQEEENLKTLAFQKIQNCEHSTVFSTTSTPHGSREFYTCVDCGLKIPAGITGRLNTGLVSIIDSDVVVKTSRYFETTYQLSEVQMDALKYPRRFSEQYLQSLFEDSPWDVSEILNNDRSHYYDSITYFNYSDWYNHVKRAAD